MIYSDRMLHQFIHKLDMGTAICGFMGGRERRGKSGQRGTEPGSVEGWSRVTKTHYMVVILRQKAQQKVQQKGTQKGTQLKYQRSEK